MVRVVAEGHESHADVRDRIAADTAEGFALEPVVLEANLEVPDLACVLLPPFSDRLVLYGAGVGYTGSCGACQAVATRIVIQVAAITARRRACSVRIRCAARRLFARIKVHGQLGNRLEDESTHRLPLPDGGHCSVRSNRGGRKLR